ncbi:porin domain, Eukaryotic porin/Tom40 [Artemisia annua]|uniref:Porin domain, Eukaryotic porin/Tom40 n=1 Tax=Artemisia annua TaxID=35608 RepID=A0A2U1MQM4_ARTAN|nr:porin domain, Eukaryotic porin/Tom40 [Artemisia annua]
MMESVILFWVKYKSSHGSTPMVSRRLTFDEVMPHTKAVLTFKVPNPRSGQCPVYIDASIGLNRSPILNLKAADDYKDVALDDEVGFDAASASFTKYTAAIVLPKFGATFLLSTPQTSKWALCKGRCSLPAIMTPNQKRNCIILGKGYIGNVSMGLSEDSKSKGKSSLFFRSKPSGSFYLDQCHKPLRSRQPETLLALTEADRKVKAADAATETNTHGNQKLLHPFYVGIQGFFMTVASAVDSHCILQPCIWELSQIGDNEKVKLHFSKKAQGLIAQKAMVNNMGARGLTAILETILTGSMYEGVHKLTNGTKTKLSLISMDPEHARNEPVVVKNTPYYKPKITLETEVMKLNPPPRWQIPDESIEVFQTAVDTQFYYHFDPDMVEELVEEGSAMLSERLVFSSILISHRFITIVMGQNRYCRFAALYLLMRICLYKISRRSLDNTKLFREHKIVSA